MRWKNKPKPAKDKIEHLQKVLQVDAIIATLLLQRDIETYQEAKTFFRPSLSNLHNPFLMKDMDLAVARIQKAIANKENIMVYGDYDVDGTTSVALVSAYLLEHYSNVTTYIPDRYAEGYGISYQSIDYAKDNEISLIIALDCGIKAIEKVAYATTKNIDFIICDHHRPAKKLPKAIAILDPKRADCSYPFKELCGCGVGFKLIQALEIAQGETSTKNIVKYLDLVATAIGADIVPIVDENRTLSYFGLQVINTKPRAGFKAIINALNKKTLTITDVVFGIAPRINAAGRMKHGNHAVTLLTETDTALAEKYALEINQYNADRKEADKKTTKEALEQLEKNKEQECFSSVVFQENWHKGVIGIVASRLIETYYRPTLVFTKSGDFLAASARSVKGFDVYNALEACSEYIEQFGGHKYAAGLILKPENYKAFKQKFEEVVKATIPKDLLIPEVLIDAEISFEQITPKLERILKQFAPFGPQNRTPVFRTNNVHDTGFVKCIGEDKTHLRVTVKQKESTNFVGIGFGLGNKKPLFEGKKLVDIVYSIDENEWQNVVSLQLRLKDVKPSSL